MSLTQIALVVGHSLSAQLTTASTDVVHSILPVCHINSILSCGFLKMTSLAKDLAFCQFYQPNLSAQRP